MRRMLAVHNSPRWFALIAGLLLLSAWVLPPQLLAQDPRPAGQGIHTDAHHEVMLADRQPTQELPALGFTPCVDGMAALFPCQDVDLLAFMPLDTIGGGQGNSIWGWTDPDTGKEYALMGLSVGTAFVDISIPTAPVYLGLLPTHSRNSGWRDIRVYQNHAFVVADMAGHHGMQIFDLTQLRQVTSPPVTFTHTAYYDNRGTMGRAHTISINTETGFAYTAGSESCNGGLHIINIQNPTQPRFAGCVDFDGYTHEAQCWVYDGPDSEYLGHEVCFNANEDTITVVDVSDKQNPVSIGRRGYAGSGYIHQGWLSDDHTYYLHNDEFDELYSNHNGRTYIWDVSDLNSLTLLGSYTAASEAVDHNLYIRGDYVFESNYRSGLRILDITDIANANLHEVAFFDVYPADDHAAFNGTWNNYPFFESGTVIASGIEQGLFVLRPHLPRDFRVIPAEQVLEICGQGEASTAVALQMGSSYTGTVTLNVTGLPEGVSALVSPSTLAVPGSSDVTLTVGSLPDGSYPLRLQATDGTLNEQHSLRLNAATSLPPTVTLTAPAPGAFHQVARPTFQWEALAPGSTYEIEIATDSAFTHIVASAHNLPYPIFTPPSDLAGYTTYYWRVRAHSACGAGPFSEPATLITRLPPGFCPTGATPQVVFADPFESPEAPGWQHQGTLLDTWKLSTERAHSGLQAWHGLNTNYRNDQSLISPPIALPLAQLPLTLQFWNAQYFPPALNECNDGALLEVSTTGPEGPWTQITTGLLTMPYHDVIQSDNPLAGQPGWCGNPQEWTEAIFDLAPYAGQTVHFRFHLGTDSDIGAAGWYIDDVQVQACLPCADILAPAGVQVQEIQAIAARWGQTITSEEWDGHFDLIFDDTIDSADVVRAAEAWGTTCP